MKKSNRQAREAFQTQKQAILQRLPQEDDTAVLINALTHLTDNTLKNNFQTLLENSGILLLAIGGYGRGELHPYSDCDLLIITPRDPDTDHTLARLIEQFVETVWDQGLQVHHSVHTEASAFALARHDLSMMTSLLEIRYVAGELPQFQRFYAQFKAQKLWDKKAFYLAKIDEQTARYARYDNTAYNLQPNVKQSPGGLRDLQTIAWIAKQHFNAVSWHDLLLHGFLNPEEYRLLLKNRDFLWRVRFALHCVAERPEERLLFDYQQQLATLFEYQDTSESLAIEAFMKDYYRVIQQLRALNDMLLQLLREAIIVPSKTIIEPINSRFRICNHYLEVTSETVFTETPSALLEVFLLLMQNPTIHGVRAETIRLIRQHKGLINADFRKNPEHHALFIELLRQPNNLTEQLQRMNRYGLLGRYLPAFGQIIGQMQHDLFHTYTVDQHVIFVVRNLRRFNSPEHRGLFPLCDKIMETISKPEVLSIAALFHDIGKGQGGDHSELGAVYVEEFCQQHGIDASDTALIVWLVKHHLLLSMTAQRKDIYDPDTIANFATAVANQKRLDHLYCLSVADICATNPTLWNSWKDSLLRELYFSTKNHLAEHNQTTTTHDIIQAKKEEAARLIDQPGNHRITELWDSFNDYYFLRETSANITWHTKAILEDRIEGAPLIAVKQLRTHRVAAVFVYMPIKPELFPVVTTLLGNLHLTILEARINASTDGYSLDSYIISADETKLAHIKKTLLSYLTEKQTIPRLIQRRLPPEIRHFDRPTRVHFRGDRTMARTIIEISTLDRPGLLSSIGRAFLRCGILLQTAKVTTVGETAEDVFFVTNDAGFPLSEEERKSLTEALILCIDTQHAA